MEDHLSGLNKAVVELDGVSISFLNSSLEWDSMQITDAENPTRNRVESGYCILNFRTIPLLKKNVIIDDITVADIRFGTQRETDGSLKKTKTDKDSAGSRTGSKIAGKIKDEISLFNLDQLSENVNVGSLLDLVEMQTPEKLDSLKTVYTQYKQELQEQIDALPTEAELDEIMRSVKRINLSKINSAKDLKELKKTIEPVLDEIKTIKKDIKTLKSSIENKLADSGSHANLLQTWVQEDYRKASGAVTNLDLSAENIGRMVFGNEIIGKIQRISSITKTIRKYYARFSPDNPKKKSPKRGMGQYIHFRSEQPDPRLWIKTISLSGEFLENTQMQGKITNIVSDQDLINASTDMILSGVDKNKTSIKLTGLVDYRSDQSKELINIDMAGINLKGLTFPSVPLLPYPVSSGIGNLTASVDFLEEDISSKIHFTSSGVNFDIDNPIGETRGKTFREICLGIAQSMDELNLDALVNKRGGTYSSDISSNLDNVISKQLDKQYAKELNAAKSKIESRVSEKTDAYRAELKTYMEQNNRDLSEKLNLKEAAIADNLEFINKLQDDIEKRLKNTIIKDIFK